MGVLLKPDKKAPQVFGRKSHHIRQFEKVYGMRTIITIVKADYGLMSQLLLNILSNVTLPPYPSFFVHFKHTFVTHPTKISRFSITVTPPPRDTACHPPQNSERAPGYQNANFFPKRVVETLKKWTPPRQVKFKCPPPPQGSEWCPKNS